MDSFSQKCVNYCRMIPAAVVQKAKSGHPGAPMGCAPIAHCLWGSIMKYDPSNPKWFNRDRFILSNGHASALQYTMLHLTGYDVPMEQLQQFRQLHSKTPGHPELECPGVEVITGPLGQGICNGVGMALAQEHLASLFNKPGFNIIDNHIFVLCGDGCLEEGITAEACSFAGHQQLKRLIVIYDDNTITIDGHTELSFSENVYERFEAYHWNVMKIEKGDTDIDGIQEAIAKAKQSNRPTLIGVRTTIGYGSSAANTHGCHGSPLGWEVIENAREQFGLPRKEYFDIPEDVLKFYRDAGMRGTEQAKAWGELMKEYEKQFPELYTELQRRIRLELKPQFNELLPPLSGASIATRATSGAVLNTLAPVYPELIGGSADLTPSNNTWLKCSQAFSLNNRSGRYIHFGVREHSMAAISNGMYAYGACLPFCATFFVFTNYMMAAMRLSAISHFRVLYILTHDSIGVGEDGPTHQPVEHLWQLRNMPSIHLVRPCDGREVTGAYTCYMNGHEPFVFALSRQNLPYLDGSSAENVAKGAYVLQDCEGEPEIILIGTGSEVSLCVDAANSLKANGKRVRVVSMPCSSLFEQQTVEYKKSVLLDHTPIIAVEAGARYGWERYSHAQICMTSFGASAPANDVYKYFGITVEKTVEKAEKLIQFYSNKTVPCKMDQMELE